MVADFSVITDNLISVFFGETWIFGLFMIALFMIIMVSLGIPFGSAMVLLMPLALGISTFGLLGAKGWIADAVLVIVGLTYATIIIRMMNRGG